MAKERRRDSTRLEQLQKASSMAVQVALLPSTLRERLNGVIYPAARVVGGLGLVVLAVWAALRFVVSPEVWAAHLDAARLPVLLALGLVAASLLGWASMSEGLRRVRGRLGQPLSSALFVLVPMLCALLSLLTAAEWIEPAEWPGGPGLVPFLRFYPPGLVVLFVAVNLIAIGRDERRGGARAALGEAALCIPYGLLLIAFVLGSWASAELRDSLEETIEALGAGAIVLQVGLAWFISAGAAGAT